MNETEQWALVILVGIVLPIWIGWLTLRIRQHREACTPMVTDASRWRPVYSAPPADEFALRPGQVRWVEAERPARFASWFEVAAIVCLGVLVVAIAIILGIWIGMRIGQHHG